MITNSIIYIYLGLFVYFACKSGLKQWLWASVVLGLATMWFLADLLPGFVYHNTGLVLHASIFCITLGSLFFFVNDWHYHSATKVFYAEPGCSPYLVYLAITGMLFHLVWLILLGWSSYQYPNGLSSFSLMALLQLYFLQPVYWIVMQWSVMLMLAWAARWRQMPVTVVSMTQIQLCFLIFLLSLSVYVVSDLSQYLR